MEVYLCNVENICTVAHVFNSEKCAQFLVKVREVRRVVKEVRIVKNYNRKSIIFAKVHAPPQHFQKETSIPESWAIAMQTPQVSHAIVPTLN